MKKYITLLAIAGLLSSCEADLACGNVTALIRTGDNTATVGLDYNRDGWTDEYWTVNYRSVRRTELGDWLCIEY